MNSKTECRPEVIVAFGFSKKGNANRAIARVAEEDSKSFKIPVFTQDDVFHVMDLEVHSIPADERNGYLSTLGMARQLQEMAPKENWKVVEVIAASMHRWRCERDLRKLGFTVVPPARQPSVLFGDWYNPTDPQIWVRNRWIWWTRELVLRVFPWPMYCWVDKVLTGRE